LHGKPASAACVERNSFRFLSCSNKRTKLRLASVRAVLVARKTCGNGPGELQSWGQGARSTAQAPCRAPCRAPCTHGRGRGRGRGRRKMCEEDRLTPGLRATLQFSRAIARPVRNCYNRSGVVNYLPCHASGCRPARLGALC
jgi:hypothetical protein